MDYCSVWRVIQSNSNIDVFKPLLGLIKLRPSKLYKYLIQLVTAREHCDYYYISYSISSKVRMITNLFNLFFIVDPNECVLFRPCENDGECIDLAEGYRCECVSGYYGKNCSQGEW